MFVLIDPDGNLLRCLDNLYQAARSASPASWAVGGPGLEFSSFWGSNGTVMADCRKREFRAEPRIARYGLLRVLIRSGDPERRYRKSE